MKALVTGATGFIGSFVVRELLAAGHEVHALVEPGVPLGRIADLASRVRVHEASLLDRAALTKAASDARADTCVHLAWYAVPGKYLHAVDNVPLVEASVALYEAVVAAGATRFVGAGTCIEYDTSHGLLREDTTPLRPRCLYAVCKNALHGMLAELAPRSAVSLAWLRFFFLYGPTEAPGRLVSDVLRKLHAGVEAPCSLGQQVRDFMHVSDVARAVVTVTESGASGAFNIGSGVPVTVREIVDTMGRVTERHDLLRVGAIAQREGDPPFICADAHKLRALGFAPRFDLEAGLRDTFASIQREKVPLR